MKTYIGFSTKTHKILYRIFCRNFKHCAPVIVIQKRYYLYQFTSTKKITIIPMTIRDIKILETYGWKFIRYQINITPKDITDINTINCVCFTKKFCGIKRIRIQTPDALYKFLTTK